MHRLTAARRTAGGEDERGSVLVLWAVALAAVMGLVALAIDLGNIGQTKQHARNAAEDAALAAAADLASLAPGGGGVASTQEAAAVNDAETYLLDNYSLTSPDWNSCGAFPSGVTAYSGADCFGFFTTGGSGAPNAMAVQVPPQTVHATLGKADGFSGASVSSTAYASVQTAGSSYLLPFAYAAGGASGLQCIKTSGGNGGGGNGGGGNGGGGGKGGGGGNGGGGGGQSSCTGFTTGSGKFGSIDSPRWFTFTGYNTASGNNPVTQTNVVLGLDHPLVSTGSEVCDVPAKASPNCSPNNTSPYTGGNYVAPATGQDSSALDGLFGTVTSPDGSCTFAPRLNHVEGFVQSGSCTADQGVATGTPPDNALTGIPHLVDTFGSSYTLNGQSVSAFLNSNGTTAAMGCAALAPPSTTPIDQQSGSTYAWANYDACLSGVIASYDPTASGSGPIFSSTITQSPRFGVVPVVDTSNGSGVEKVVGLDDVYLDVMFAGGNGDTVAQVSAWIFPQQDVAQAPTSGQGLGGNYGGPYVVNLCSYAAGNC